MANSRAFVARLRAAPGEHARATEQLAGSSTGGRDERGDVAVSETLSSTQHPPVTRLVDRVSLVAYDSDHSISDNDGLQFGRRLPAGEPIEASALAALSTGVAATVETLIGTVVVAEQTARFAASVTPGRRLLARSSSLTDLCHPPTACVTSRRLQRVCSFPSVFFPALDLAKNVVLTPALVAALQSDPSTPQMGAEETVPMQMSIANEASTARMESPEVTASSQAVVSRVESAEESDDDGVQILFAEEPTVHFEVSDPFTFATQTATDDLLDRSSTGAACSSAWSVSSLSPAPTEKEPDDAIQHSSPVGDERVAECTVRVTRLPTDPKQLRNIARRAHAADISRRLGRERVAEADSVIASSRTSRTTTRESTDAPKKKTTSKREKAHSADAVRKKTACSRSKTVTFADQEKSTTAEDVAPRAGAVKSSIEESISAVKKKKSGKESKKGPNAGKAGRSLSATPADRCSSVGSTRSQSATKRRRLSDASEEAQDVAASHSSRSSAKRPKRRSAEKDSSSSDDSTSTDDEDFVQPSVERPRKKTDVETRAREYILSHPEELFPEADLVAVALAAEGISKKNKRAISEARLRSKTIPLAYVPPRLAADRDRPRKTKKELRRVVRQFVADQNATLLLEVYQHFERVQIIRILISLAFSGVRNVEPLIRLVRQNGRTPNDPISLLAGTLTPALIDTRQGTQANSAHLTVLYYLLPVFVQRWGVMAAATSNSVQWRSLGQMLNNWNTHGRWPELLIAAPTEVAEIARRIRDGPDDVPPTAFQAVLAEFFSANPDALARWCFIRRCSKAVNVDTSGQSLCVDLIVPPMAIWLRAIAPVPVATACATADALALAPNPSDRIVYPSFDVYQEAMVTLTQVLAGTSPDAAYSRLVQESLSAESSANCTTQPFTYSGADPTLHAAIQSFADAPPVTVDVAVVANAESLPALAISYRWPTSEGESAEPDVVFRVTVPVLEWRTIGNALLGRSDEPLLERDDQTDLVATGSSVLADSFPPDSFQKNVTSIPKASPVFVQISGLRGSVTDETVRGLLATFGTLTDVCYAEEQGVIVAQFEGVSGAANTVVGIYSTITRAEFIHAVIISEECQAAVLASAKTLRARLSSTKVFAKAPAALDLATPSGVPSEEASAAALTVVLTKARNRQEQLFAERSSTPTSGIAVSADADYDATVTFEEVKALLAGGNPPASTALLAGLRVIVMDHLQLNPTDHVVVVPPDWLDLTDGVLGAAASPKLLDANGANVNVGHARILFCPIFVSNQPYLVMIAFPESLDVFAEKLVPPFVVLVGVNFSPAIEHNLLVSLFIRLEATLQTRTAVTRPNVAVVKLGRAAKRPKTATTETVLELVHAAHVLLQLTSTTESLPICATFFTDTDRLSAFSTVLSQLIDVQSHNSASTRTEASRRSQLLDEWRALAALAKTTKPVQWQRTMLAAAYTSYTAHRYLRAQNQENWSSRSAVAEFVATPSVKLGYELILCELRDAGKAVLRAFFARLHQLYQRGFYVLGATNQTIEVCRKSTEHALLRFPDFSLWHDERTYSNEEERKDTKIGWGSPPIAEY